MKSFLVVMILALLVCVPTTRADGPDDQYVAIYTLIQQGDTLNEKGQLSAAVSKYGEAQSALKRFQASYPDAYVKVVRYRLNYLDSKISQLSSAIQSATPPKPATHAPAPAPASTTPSAPENSVPVNTPSPQSTPAPITAPPSAEFENQIKGLQEQVHRLETDRSTLEAKLKEALAAQPAAVDPQEMAKVQAQVTSLQKENELLKTTLAMAKTNVSPAQATAADLEKNQAALTEANRKVAALTEANATLALEKEALQNHIKTMATPDANTTALREENEILKKQLAELKVKSASASSVDAVNQKLQEAQAQMAALQSDKEILRLEKVALENKVKQLVAAPGSVAAVAAVPPAPAATVPPAPAVTVAPVAATNAVVTNTASITPEMLDSVTAAKIAQLEAQRDELKKNVDAATRDLQGRRKGKELVARMDEMTRQLAFTHARIEVLEAHEVPYTEAELALMAKPEATLMASVHSSAKKAIKDLPSAAAAKLAEGKQYFMAHEYDKAEAKYLEVLKYDEKNFATMADLASIQLEAGRLADAEKNLKAALAIEPNDDYSLFVLGQLKFRQKNYNESFDALSRAAQINPQNARIQNFLGLTLSEKGLRGPAETAFRKSIQIDPGFAEAHINLAVVYATQQPPLLELARWHYQKAMAAGHAPNPSLEKLLDANRAIIGTH